MKLNNKRTILVGLAFLSICAFWQMYDSIVPLILTKTFHMNETFSGAIMAADNILALFLLPFFGSVSDKSHSKLGKRMPFILFGTGCAIILMNILPLLDNSYAAQPSGFKTASFVIVLGLLLVAMGTYRAPAVALMPDVTPKPLRSRANAIINLMGAVGGILYLGVAAVRYPNSKTAGLDHVNYQPLFIVVSAIMFVVFALVGLAWAAINVNSLPMVVEMCKGSDIGKFTGYYYTASMAAQVVTPIAAGTLMRKIDYRVLFPYAALFVALSFVTMLFVHHGDAKAEAKKGLEAFEEMDD